MEPLKGLTRPGPSPGGDFPGLLGVAQGCARSFVSSPPASPGHLPHPHVGEAGAWAGRSPAPWSPGELARLAPPGGLAAGPPAINGTHPQAEHPWAFGEAGGRRWGDGRVTQGLCACAASPGLGRRLAEAPALPVQPLPGWRPGAHPPLRTLWLRCVLRRSMWSDCARSPSHTWGVVEPALCGCRWRARWVLWP